jgi:hypothetical protein
MKNISKENMIPVLGSLGIVSVVITIISDFILIGKPNSAFAFLMLGTESMWDIPASRIAAGAFIGVAVLPFQLLGLVPAYFALKPAGRLLPMMAVIANAHTLLMGVAFHISYAFIGSGWILHHQENADGITSGLMDRFDLYWRILAVIMFVELLFSSVIYTIVILKGKSLFPKWMAVFNPVGVTVMAFPPVFMLPYPVGGYIAPAYLNISTMIFFIMTLAVGYRRIKEASVYKEE